MSESLHRHQRDAKWGNWSDFSASRILIPWECREATTQWESQVIQCHCQKWYSTLDESNYTEIKEHLSTNLSDCMVNCLWVNYWSWHPGKIQSLWVCQKLEQCQPNYYIVISFCIYLNFCIEWIPYCALDLLLLVKKLTCSVFWILIWVPSGSAVVILSGCWHNKLTHCNNYL